MALAPFIWKSRIRFGDTDASGRVFYISLLRHFESAEFEFLRSLGVGYREMQAAGTDFPRVHVECDYSSPIGFDDLMDIAVSVERVGRASFTLGFLVSVEGREAARAKLVVAAMDPKTHRATPLPERLKHQLQSKLDLP